jgi:hypothetical protein
MWYFFPEMVDILVFYGLEKWKCGKGRPMFFLCITWVQPRFLFLKIYLFVFSKEYYVSCNGGHHRFSFNRYKNWHFVDLWNITHIISFNKSTLDRKEGAIMNGQSRDIATLDPQGTKKDNQITKTKHRKLKRRATLSRSTISGHEW